MDFGGQITIHTVTVGIGCAQCNITNYILAICCLCKCNTGHHTGKQTSREQQAYPGTEYSVKSIFHNSLLIIVSGA
jgi:hypothetical protein